MRDAGRPPSVDRGIAHSASDEVREAIARLGRTEDLQFSPAGDRVAIAAFHQNRILILGVEACWEDPSIRLTDPLELKSRSFYNPHGLCWIDERTIVVANRSAEVALYEVPGKGTSGVVEIKPVRRFGECIRQLLKTPGSVALAPVGLDLVQLAVANNYVNHVSLHLIDRRNDHDLVASYVLAHEGLDVPDGVEFSPSGNWIAVSNHNHHQVLIFRTDQTAGGPQGRLKGVRYPHGLHFAEGGQALLVADAGAPFVYLFRSHDWCGELAPAAAFRVMSDDAYTKGNINPTEGGPKGIDVTRDGRLMATTCHEQPLAFFDMREILRPELATEETDPAEQVREVLMRFMTSDRSRVDAETAAMRRAMDFELAVVRGSRSWRITTPLRKLTAFLRWIAPGWSARHL